MERKAGRSQMDTERRLRPQHWSPERTPTQGWSVPRDRTYVPVGGEIDESLIEAPASFRSRNSNNMAARSCYGRRVSTASDASEGSQLADGTWRPLSAKVAASVQKDSRVTDAIRGQVLAGDLRLKHAYAGKSFEDVQTIQPPRSASALRKEKSQWDATYGSPGSEGAVDQASPEYGGARAGTATPPPLPFGLTHGFKQRQPRVFTTDATSAERPYSVPFHGAPPPVYVYKSRMKYDQPGAQSGTRLRDMEVHHLPTERPWTGAEHRIIDRVESFAILKKAEDELFLNELEMHLGAKIHLKDVLYLDASDDFDTPRTAEALKAPRTPGQHHGNSHEKPWPNVKRRMSSDDPNVESKVRQQLEGLLYDEYDNTLASTTPRAQRPPKKVPAVPCSPNESPNTAAHRAQQVAWPEEGGYVSREESIEAVANTWTEAAPASNEPQRLDFDE